MAVAHKNLRVVIHDINNFLQIFGRHLSGSLGGGGPRSFFDRFCELFCQRSYGIRSKLIESALMCTTVCTCL
jgi:hypothetical protein